MSSGRVAVNGVVVDHPGTPVIPGEDRVEVDGRAVSPGELQYILLHKPTGYVTSRHDPEGRPTIYELLPLPLHPLHYVGRLDLTTTGLLLLTNDGALSYRLTRPEYKVDKVYEVKVRGDVSDAVLTRAVAGVEDRGETLRARAVSISRQLATNTLLEVTLTEGKNREVRRLFEAQGLHIVRLARIAFAGLTLGNLKSGDWRELSAAEVAALKGSVKTPGQEKTC